MIVVRRDRVKGPERAWPAWTLPFRLPAIALVAALVILVVIMWPEYTGVLAMLSWLIGLGGYVVNAIRGDAAAAIPRWIYACLGTGLALLIIYVLIMESS